MGLAMLLLLSQSTKKDTMNRRGTIKTTVRAIDRFMNGNLTYTRKPSPKAQFSSHGIKTKQPSLYYRDLKSQELIASGISQKEGESETKLNQDTVKRCLRSG